MPACPKCGAPMRLRTARRGRWAGFRFHGCSRWPDCDGTRPGPGQSILIGLGNLICWVMAIIFVGMAVWSVIWLLFL